MKDSDITGLLSRLKEIDELLSFPSVAGHIEQAGRLALSLARNAPTGNIANLAMKLASEIDPQRQAGLSATPSRHARRQLLEQLRTALIEAQPKGIK